MKICQTEKLFPCSIQWVKHPVKLKGESDIYVVIVMV